MHTEPSDLPGLSINHVTPIPFIPEDQADNSPASVAEVSAMVGVLAAHGAVPSPEWAAIVLQIPLYAISTGITIEAAWAAPAAVVIPAITANMGAVLSSDRFTQAAAELTAISDSMRKLQAPST